MVTLPVGTGAPGWPVTVTKSWTVVPTATVVTVWWAALWIAVAVVVMSWVIRLSEAAPTFGGFGLQFELPVRAGSLHRSCQPSETSSRSWWPGRAKSAAWTV